MCQRERARIRAACVHAFVCRHFCGRVCIEDSVNSHGCVSVVLVFGFQSPQQSDLIKIQNKAKKRKEFYHIPAFAFRKTKAGSSVLSGEVMIY